MAAKQKSPPQSPALSIVWQWVTYALWGLGLLALSGLLVSTISHFVNPVPDGSIDSFSIYALAAVLCLLTPAYIVDGRYSAQEPETKQGFAGIVMVVHAVIAFIATIGALITALMSALSFVVDGTISKELLVTLLSAVVITLLGSLLFIRIVQPDTLKRLSHYFRHITIAIAILVVAFAVVGPVRLLIETRDDRRITFALNTIQAAINTYAQDHKQLPKQLKDLPLQDETATVVARGLIRYNPSTNTPTGPTPFVKNETVTYNYTLCATFKAVSGSGQHINKQNIYAHPAGDYCYELNTTVFDDGTAIPAIKEGM